MDPIGIGGLNDEDTKQEVLSRVEEMTLDATVTFVEVRETGRSATKTLGGKMSSTVVNQVQERADQRSCTYCGKKGHGRRANFETRKANCPQPDMHQVPVPAKTISPQSANLGRATRLMTTSLTPRRQEPVQTKSPSTG